MTRSRAAGVTTVALLLASGIPSTGANERQDESHDMRRTHMRRLPKTLATAIAGACLLAGSLVEPLSLPAVASDESAAYETDQVATQSAAVDQAAIQHAMDMRAFYGLPADEALVRDLLDSAQDVGSGRIGIPMTDEEWTAVDINDRTRFSVDVHRKVEPWLDGRAVFAGMAFDQQHDGRLVVWVTGRTKAITEGIRERMPADSRGFVVVTVEHTLEELLTALHRVPKVSARLDPSGELATWGVDLANNGLRLTYANGTAERMQARQADFESALGVPVAIVAGPMVGDTIGDTTGPPSDQTTSGAAVAQADVPRASASPADAKEAGAALEAFGLDLYRALAPGQTNMVFSPTSIALALAMARAGAEGQTAVEMDAVMHDLASDDRAGYLAALDQALASRNRTFTDGAGEELPVTLRIANAPFAQEGMPLEATYLETLAARYGAGVRLADYQTTTEEARQTINAWVDEQTEQRIPELLVEGVLTPATRLTLVNAIYLKAPWQTPFMEGATTDGTFTRADGSTVEVPFMSSSTSLPHASDDGWQAVELPYLGGQLAMTLILPDDLAGFERMLTPDGLATITSSLTDTQVALALPKFGIETNADLATVLAALGMPTAFTDAADFSGITTAEQLAISDVVHQANIDVDEKGTEAAAATAVAMRQSAMPAEGVTVRLDRPFLFALRDVPTGAILFLGRVGDPSIGR